MGEGRAHRPFGGWLGCWGPRLEGGRAGGWARVMPTQPQRTELVSLSALGAFLYRLPCPCKADTEGPQNCWK